MKKKMLFICAAGLLTAGIASAIESANIVGYKKVEGPVGGGFTIITSPFVSVLSPNQTFTLSQLTGNFRNNQTIQFLDSSGRVESMALYWAGEWYDFFDDEIYVGDDPIDAGKGMFVATGTYTFDGFIAGQVEEDDITFPLNNGLTLVGNASPVTLKLEEIEFSGLRNNNTLQFLDERGRVVSMALYWAGEWYDFYDDEIYVGDTWEVLPGEGFFVQCPGGSITIPTAFPKSL